MLGTGFAAVSETYCMRRWAEFWVPEGLDTTLATAMVDPVLSAATETARCYQGESSRNRKEQFKMREYKDWNVCTPDRKG